MKKLLTVLVILVIISGCSSESDPGKGYTKALRKGDKLRAQGDLKTLKTAAGRYLKDQGEAPPADDVEGLCEQLKPSYIRACPEDDPWGSKYRYNKDKRKIFSIGPDKKAMTKDDIEREF